MKREIPRDIVAKGLENNIIVSEIELHSSSYVSFQTYAWGSYGTPIDALDNVTTILLQ